MTHEEAVRLAIATKLMIRTRRKINEITKDHECHGRCKANLMTTMSSLIKFGSEVYSYRPEYYISIVVLAEAISGMIEELDRAFMCDNVIRL